MAFVEYEVQGQIGIITMNRPEKLNALSPEVIRVLGEVIDEMRPMVFEDKIRCVLVKGAGEKAFVAGADIAAMSTMTPSEGYLSSKLENDVTSMLETFPCPVIAVINGYALGGGMELSMCCDIRICSERSVFGQPEVGLGIIPGGGGTQRLARLCGAGRAKELIYTQRKIKAQEAFDIGLVQAVYPTEQLWDEALKLAQSICDQSPIGVRMSKLAINGGLNMTIEQGLEYESRLFSACVGTEDQREAMKAFVEKRPHAPFVNK